MKDKCREQQPTKEGNCQIGTKASSISGEAPNNSLKPTTYRAAVQRFVAVSIYFWESCLASTGGGLVRCRWAAMAAYSQADE